MREIPVGMTVNAPTPEGIALGRELARFFDIEQPKVEAQFPGSTERCKSCAFREGTYPNGCPETVVDALDCAVTGKPFYCHVGLVDGEPKRLCAGWAVLQGGDIATALACHSLVDEVKIVIPLDPQADAAVG